MNKFNIEEQNSIYKAISIIETLALKTSLIATNSEAVKNYCRLQLGSLERENFGILFLNNQNQLISFEVLFKGSINAAAVYPMQCVKRALELNSASLILTHNHPGGCNEPSIADKEITVRLVDAFKLLDIRVIDHVIVSCTGTYSFAEHNLL